MERAHFRPLGDLEMRSLACGFRVFVNNSDGATMAEYGFLILLVASICAGAVALLGNKVAQLFAVPGL